MKTSTAVAILLLATFALSSITMIQIRPAKASGTLTLSDAELMLPEFKWLFDSGSSLAGRTLIGPGVRFDLAGLGKAGVGDDYPVNQLAGGAWTGSHYSDFTGYSKYSMLFVNLGSGTIQVSLYLNTGFTTSPGRDYRYDTFWCSNWVTINPHQSAIVTLDFSSSGQAWNIADDPVYTGHVDGETGTAIWRLDEVTNIGFQALGSGSASVLVSGTLTQLYINPSVVSKTPGDVGTTFPADVMLSDFANLAGFDIKLTWDNSLITETGVDYTTALNALWGVGKWSAFEYSGAGYYELVAAALATSASSTAAQALFTLTFQVAKSCNFPLSTSIHFALVKLSDNATPIPNPITATVTDGLYTMSNTKPDLEFKVLKYNKTTHTYEPVTLPDHFEYGNNFEVEVYVTDISVNSQLEDYDVTIDFDPGLAAFLHVDAWGIFGTGNVVYTPGTPNAIHVTGNGAPWYGPEGLLFTLTFHVEFAATPDHIWKYGHTNFMTFSMWLADATLSFGSLGTIPMGGIIIPVALSFEVDFIRGDVDCNGAVNTADIGDVAYYNNQPATVRPEYDLNNDNVIDVYDLVTVATNYGYGM